MTNILDYIAWRGDLTFEKAPFCEVDNLIFSMLSFIDYDGIASDGILGMPVKLSRCLEMSLEKHPDGEKFGIIVPEATYELFKAAAVSTRFSDVYVTNYRSETSESDFLQFAAVTFILPDNTLFVAYRGTDDSLVGWREDFNLSFTYPVKAQTMAAEYLFDTASVHRGKIRIGGHSKGGNLSVYAAVTANVELRSRITAVYNNDGPGFVKEFIELPEYAEMEGRITTFVPQSSIIGMLLEHKENYKVIESSSANGFFQHNPFSWSVVGASFVHLDGLSKEGRRNDEVIDEWLRGISPDERRIFTETLFNVLESTGAKTVTDLTEVTTAKLAAVIRAFGELDKETKEHMISFIRRLAEASMTVRKTSHQ